MAPTYEVDVLTHNSFSNPAIIAEQTALYRENLTGMLTNNGGDIIAFSRLPDNSISNSTLNEIESFSQDWPHIMFMFLDAYLGYNNNSQSAPAGNFISPMVALVAPFSRGNITIMSNDTIDNPQLSPNWLLDPRDQEMAVAAFKHARQVMTQNISSPVVIGTEAFPGLDVSTDAEILALVQKQAFSSYHGSCTCAMGSQNNSMAVVDSYARVYGVQNLRVVDASAFPVLPPGAPAHTVCKSILTSPNIKKNLRCILPTADPRFL